MKYLNYILVIVGAFTSMYTKTSVTENQYILIGGIILLMIGIYRISKNIPSKANKIEDDNTDTKLL